MAISKISGVELYYELHGEGEDVLVLNNGVIASTATWVYQLPALIGHFRVLLYDMRGQGQSGKWQEGEPPYTWATHADDLAALLDHLQVEQAHIGGISYGGELTLVFALRHPERCRKLFVADAASHVQPQLKAIFGGQDRLKPPHYARKIAAEIPESELHLLTGAGHASLWEAAAAFNSIVLGFLLKPW